MPTLPVRRGGLAVLRDFVAPFVRGGGMEVEYRMERKGEELVVRGESMRKDAKGNSVLRSRVVLVRGEGVMEIEMEWKGKKRRIVRASASASASATTTTIGTAIVTMGVEKCA